MDKNSQSGIYLYGTLCAVQGLQLDDEFHRKIAGTYLYRCKRLYRKCGRREQTISFKAPYRRLPILDAIKEKTGYDLNGKTEEEIRQVLQEN